jgi:hypothetical protein
MNETKVQFSNTEMELMCNQELILTKNRVVEKVKTLLEEIQNQMMDDCRNNTQLSSTEIFSVTPKISKGENYLGLPYQILDYPRLFRHQDVFAIRTMFWWGNFFSITLHLSGLYKLQYEAKVQAGFKYFANEGYSIGVNEDPWIHHFDEDNYKEIVLLNEKTFGEECTKAHHLKIAKKISLKDADLRKQILENWQLLIAVCFN